MTNSADFDSIKALTPLMGFMPGSIGALYHLYKAIGPEMPSNLQPTSVKSDIPGAPVMHFNYDEGHAGRFSVPGTEGGSLDFDWVMARNDPVSFIMDNLAFRDKAGNAASQDGKHNIKSATEQEAGEEAEGEDEVQTQSSASPEFTVFVPGLNTVHEPREGESTTVERLQHYVRVLGGVPMAQIHMGTSFDQGEIRLNAGGPLIQALFNNALLPSSLHARNDNGQLVWDSRQIDRLQAALSKVNLIDTPAKSRMRQLIALAVDGSISPVVLVAYSRASIEVEGAIKGFVKERLEDGSSNEDIEQALRKSVTIVTVGSATAGFPDGPAYVHIAAWTDPLASTSGVTATNNTSGGGADALYLNCDSPYHGEAFDNHNFGAVTGQFVGIVLALNKARGFRQLWDLAQADELVFPDGNQLTEAGIELTKGYDWLWNPDAAWKDIPYGALPPSDVAERVLREGVGDAFVDRLLKNFTVES